MDGYDEDFVDMEEPGHFTFKGKGIGSFQFGSMQGEMDCRIDASRVEFTWSGFCEGDEVSGRGFAEIVSGELCGRLYVHLGDDYNFRAIKQK